MYEVKSNLKRIGNDDTIVTYGRKVSEGVFDIYAEGGSSTNRERDMITYFKISTTSPNSRFKPFIVNTFGENGSDGFEVYIRGGASARLLIIALKFIRKAICDCIRGKVF